MELFSSVKNTGAFTLCFMRSFRRRIAVGSLAGALLLGRRAAVWAGALLLDRCGALLLGQRTEAGIGARRGRLAAAVRTMRRRRRPCFWLFCGRIVVLEAVTRVASCADRLRRDRMTESSRTFEAVGDGEGQKLVAAGRRKTTGCGWLSGGGYLPVAAESDEGRPTCSESAAGSSWCSSLSVRLFSALRT